MDMLSNYVFLIGQLSWVANPEPDEEFNLFLLSLVLLGMLAMLAFVIVGVVLTILALVALFALISMGALSVSVLVGIRQKSVAKGFKTFAIVFTTSVASLVGAVSFWIINSFLKWVSDATAIATGFSIGLISGLLTGIAIAFVIQKIVPVLQSAMSKNSKKQL